VNITNTGYTACSLEYASVRCCMAHGTHAAETCVFRCVWCRHTSRRHALKLVIC